jgi:hypothetical protein
VSKSQIRKQAAEVRERIRYGVEAVRFANGDAPVDWFEGAKDLTRELEKGALATVHKVEAELTTLRKASAAMLRVVEEGRHIEPRGAETIALREALGKGPRSDTVHTTSEYLAALLAGKDPHLTRLTPVGLVELTALIEALDEHDGAFDDHDRAQAALIEAARALVLSIP